MDAPSPQGPTAAAPAGSIRAGMLYRGKLYANPAVLSNDAGAQLAEAVEAAGLALDTDLRRQPPAVAPAKPEKPKP